MRFKRTATFPLCQRGIQYSWLPVQDAAILDDRSAKMLALGEATVEHWRERGGRVADIPGIVIPELVERFEDALNADIAARAR